MFPNPRLDGLAVTLPVAAVPNPESATFCGLLLAESLKLNVAVRVPADSGLNRIVTVQLAAAARLEPHVLLEIKKSVALAPVIDTPLIEIETEPPFVNVTDFPAPTLPSATWAQLRLDGLTVPAARHSDAQTKNRVRTASGIHGLSIFGLSFEAIEGGAKGIRINCVIAFFMGGYLLCEERT